jgi:hypothetical protein
MSDRVGSQAAVTPWRLISSRGRLSFPFSVRVATASARAHYLEGGLPLSLDPHNPAASYLRVYPATLMLAVTLAIWAGIARGLIERLARRRPAKRHC